MDYKEKYQEALDLARTFHEGYIIQGHDGEAGILAEIFPELKENEDEKIRKAILELVRQSSEVLGTKNQNNMIAWLERQRPADKVEPKFHKGAWVVSEVTGSVYQIKDCIENVTNHKYGYDLTNGKYIGSCDVNHYHLWTIADAKDGDVLSFYLEYKGNKMVQTGIIEKYVGKHGGCSNTFKVYVGVDWENNFQIGEYMGCSDIRPSTKEQRDLLFQKMREVGYEWDSEKKELKKIEATSKESEDEITRKSLIRFLKSPFVRENIIDEKVAPWIAWLEKQCEQTKE